MKKGVKKNMMNEHLAISESHPLIARFFDYKHFTYPWHFHSEYEIMYIKQGEGSRFVGNDVDRFESGVIILFGSNLPHYMKSDEIYYNSDNDLRVSGTIVQFEKEFMHHSIRHYPHFARIRKLLEESEFGLYFPCNCSKKMVENLDRIPLESGVDQITSLLQLLNEMSMIESRQKISTLDYTPNTRAEASRIDKILSYLNKNYTRNISLDEISGMAAMNSTAFCRFFKKNTGKSLTKYITDMRIAYACKLLLIDKLNISQVSIESGFESISYFNTTFKKYTGYTPTEYKKVMM